MSLSGRATAWTFRKTGPRQCWITRFGSMQSKDGIIRTSYFTPAHAPERDVLAETGLQSWLCIRSIGKRADAILGFDGLSVCSLGCRDDASLFRMAFDAIANAVDRALLEQEKEKLEANLQRAERMETIGTFASGIAHNFNNIVAAIHG